MSDGTAPQGCRFDVILNARSGTFDKRAIAARVSEVLAARGITARVQLVDPQDLPAAAARATEGDADVVVAGGGDGTIATIATPVLDTGKTLAVLPLGTFNYFAQRVGVPLEVEPAIELLASSTAVRPMTVGEVNGRVFLNNASIGIYPSMLRQREATYKRVGRSQAVAYLSAAFALVQPPGLLDLQLTADGEPLVRKTALLFVGVNPLQMEAFGIAGHDCPEQGLLAACITKPMATTELWRVALRGYLRGLEGSTEFEVICASELSVSLRSKRVRVAMDGEIARLQSPLRFRIRPDALRVLVPG